MMLWLILIGILIIIYLVERLVLYVNTLTEGYHKILEAIINSKEPEPTDDWTRKEERQMKIEIKPDWSKAPEWAKYLAVDQDGSIVFYECKPIIIDDFWDPKDGDYEYVTGYNNDGIMVENWEDTLQERPAR